MRSSDCLNGEKNHALWLWKSILATLYPGTTMGTALADASIKQPLPLHGNGSDERYHSAQGKFQLQEKLSCLDAE